MIIKRTKTFAAPTGFIGTANKLAARSSGQAAGKLAATSKLAAPPIGKPLPASLKTTGLGSINTAAKQATPPSKAVNMAKSTFKSSVTTTKPIAGFNPTMTFI